MSHAYLPSSGPIYLSNRTKTPAQTQPRHSSERHSNFWNPEWRIVRIGLLELCYVHQICHSEAITIQTIVMWTVQSDWVLTVCCRSRWRRAKTQGGRGHLLTWAVPSRISVTIWLTAVTFNGLKAVVRSALSQAWPVMVSLKCPEHVF